MAVISGTGGPSPERICDCWCHRENVAELDWCLRCDNSYADLCSERHDDPYGPLGAGVVIPKEARL